MERWTDLQQLRFGSGSSMEDYMFLYGIVQHLRCTKIVEIGTNFGGGCITSALAMKENHSADPEAHVWTFDIVSAYQTICTDQARQLSVNDMITQTIGTSDDVKNLDVKHFDLGIIDGDHTVESVTKDYENLRYLCDYLLFHDVHSCGGSQAQYKAMTVEKCGFFNRKPGHIWCNGEMRQLHTCFQGWAVAKGDYKK